MPIKVFDVKRIRKGYLGRERWVTIGTCIIAENDNSGTLYLHQLDEDLKLYPRKRKKNEIHE